MVINKPVIFNKYQIVFLLLCIGVQLFRIRNEKCDFYNCAVDFIHLYCGASLVLNGEDPYVDSRLNEKWNAIARRDNFIPVYKPGMPRPLLYPPWALSFFLPFALFPYKTAVIFWYGILSLSIIIGIYFLGKLYAHYNRIPAPFLDIAIVYFAFKPIAIIFLSGQPTFLFVGIAAALLYYRSTRPILSGILLGIASIKFTLAIPFYCLFIFKGRFKIVVAALITVLIFSLLFLLVGRCYNLCIPSYLSLIDTFNSFRLPPTFDFSFFRQNIGETVTISELGTLLYLIVPGNKLLLNGLYLFVWIGMLVFTGKKIINKRIDVFSALLLLYSTVMLTTYFQYYDLLFYLLVLTFVLPKANPLLRKLIIGVNVLQFIPVLGILHALPFAVRTYFSVITLYQPVLAICNCSLILFLTSHPQLSTDE